jgi:hypothetical protein
MNENLEKLAIELFKSYVEEKNWKLFIDKLSKFEQIIREEDNKIINQLQKDYDTLYESLIKREV